MPKTPKLPLPTEHDEQVMVCRWLRARHIPFGAIPNGANKSIAARMKFKAEGLTPGMPDLLIITPPPAFPHMHLLVEMKRQKGGRLSVEQDHMHSVLSVNGFLVITANGYADAVRQLRDLGYDKLF